VTREGRRPSPDAPWDWEVRRVDSDLPTELARADDEPWGMGMGALPEPGMAIGFDIPMRG
jgi:hypothetical protein